MPEEIRKIVFCIDEIFEALIAFCLRSHIIVPQGFVDEVKLKGSESAFIVLVYGAVDGNVQKKLSFSKDQVAAALISYCRQNRIPIPKSAKKLLKIEDNKIVYLVRFGRIVSRGKISSHVNTDQKALSDQ